MHGTTLIRVAAKMKHGSLLMAKPKSIAGCIVAGWFCSYRKERYTGAGDTDQFLDELEQRKNEVKGKIVSIIISLTINYSKPQPAIRRKDVAVIQQYAANMVVVVSPL